MTESSRPKKTRRRHHSRPRRAYWSENGSCSSHTGESVRVGRRVDEVDRVHQTPGHAGRRFLQVSWWSPMLPLKKEEGLLV